MTKVYRTYKPKSPPGYAGRQGKQQSMNDHWTRKALEASKAGKSSFEYGNELFVLCEGKFIPWHRADPSKVGK